MKLPRLPFGRKADGSSAVRRRATQRRELLEMRPQRNPRLQWEERDGAVVLQIRRKSNWKTRLAGLVVPVPEDRTVVLDAIGTDVWKQLDGQTSVQQIVQSLAKKYKLSAREAEISLQQFFKELSRRGYVILTAPAQEPARTPSDQVK